MTGQARQVMHDPGFRRSRRRDLGDDVGYLDAMGGADAIVAGQAATINWRFTDVDEDHVFGLVEP